VLKGSQWPVAESSTFRTGSSRIQRDRGGMQANQLYGIHFPLAVETALSDFYSVAKGHCIGIHSSGVVAVADVPLSRRSGIGSVGLLRHHQTQIVVLHCTSSQTSFR
jgi:hypothetical protein